MIGPPSHVPVSIISPQGRFKYILIKGESTTGVLRFVRGHIQYHHHCQNFMAFTEEIKHRGYNVQNVDETAGTFTASLGKRIIKFKCQGGGRIEHDSQKKKCFIYGYSNSYGKVNHSDTARIVAKELNYKIGTIKTSQGGY